jgi:hypothetical protein
MATKVLLKKSSVAGKVPATNDLDYGELALNYADGKLYFKDSTNAVKHFIESSQSSAPLSIDDLTDVDTTTSPAVLNQALVWDGTNWVPGTPSTTSIIIEDGVSLTTTQPSQIVDTFNKTVYRTAKYLLQAISDGEVHATEVTITHNDTNVFINEYGNMYTGSSSLIIVSAEIDATNVYLTVTPSKSNTIIDFTRISIISRILGNVTSGLEGDLMLLTGSEDLMTGSGTIDLMGDNGIDGDLMTPSSTVDLMLGSGTIDLLT